MSLWREKVHDREELQMLNDPMCLETLRICGLLNILSVNYHGYSTGQFVTIDLIIIY